MRIIELPFDCRANACVFHKTVPSRCSGFKERQTLPELFRFHLLTTAMTLLQHVHTDRQRTMSAAKLFRLRIRTVALLLVSLLFTAPHINAQVATGGLMIVGQNSEATMFNSFKDELAVVALVDLDVGTTFFLTDGAIQSAGGTTLALPSTLDGYVQITITGAVTAGTIFTFDFPSGGGTVTVTGISATLSNQSGWNTNIAIGGGGDTWHLYNATTASTPTSFISAFTNSRFATGNFVPSSSPPNSADSYLGAGLTIGVNATAIGLSADHLDNQHYNGTLTGDAATLAGLIATGTNWTGNDLTNNDITVDGASVFGTSNPAFTITEALPVGSLAIVGINVDGSSGDDQIAVVALTDIGASSTFFITDGGIQSDLSTLDVSSSTNGYVQITTTATINAGTVFTFTIPGNSGAVTVSGISATLSNQSGWGGGTPQGGGGDSWHIYNASSSSPGTPTSFIYAFSNSSQMDADTFDPKESTTSFNSTESYLGSGLAIGSEAVAITGVDHEDNLYYNGSLTGDSATVLGNISNKNNWTGNSSTNNDITVNGASVFGASNPAFTIGSTAVAASFTAQTNVLCHGESTGSLTVTATGGTTPYSYVWTGGGSSTQTNSGLTAGTYTVTVTDANGTSQTASETITQPTAALVASASVSNALDCFGDSDGEVTASQTGGTSGYSYSWNTGPTSASINGLTATTYSVTITDANSCTDSTSVQLTQPVALVASASVSNTLNCFGDSDGEVTASQTGGTSGYSYSWNTGPTSASITGLTATTYSVTITDANSCTDSASVELTQPVALVASASVSNTLNCFGDSDGEVTASQTGGTSGYSYSWNTGPTSASINGLTATTYSVTITDANSCTDSASVELTQPTALVVSVTVDSNESCTGLSNGGVTANASGGTSSYSYSWSNSQTSTVLTNLTGATYTVVVTDANGCTESAQNTVSTGASPSVSISSTTHPTCNGDSDGSLTALASSGSSPYEYAWSSGGNSATETSLANGTYTIVITDVNGCTATTSGSVTDPSTISLSTSATNVTCTGDGNGSIDLTASGGTGTLSYLWSPGSASSEDISGLSGGSYSVVVTDANGCTETTSETVNEASTLLAVSAAHMDATCNGDSDGSIDLTVTGGQTSFTYSWSDGSSTIATTEDISSLAAGTYSVTVTDAYGCEKTTSSTINEPAVLDAGTVLTN